MVNRRTFRFIFILLFAGLLAAAFSAHAQDTPPVEVRVAPPSIQVAVGQTVEVAVEVVDVQALYGADISLAFDPAVVKVVDADPGTEGVQVAFGTFLDPGFVMRNEADNAAGTLRFAMTQINPSEPKSGSGVVVVVKLRGEQAGASTPLTLVDVQPVQRDGTILPTTLVSGQVKVVASPGEQPTNTPMPTQNPSIFETPTATAAPPTATPTAGSSRVTPTSTPTATSVPPTNTPLSSATPEPPTATPVPAATTASSEPTATLTPIVIVLEPSATLTPIVIALEPSATPTALPPTATPAEPSSTATDRASPPEALWVGAGLLGLAALFALALFVVRRRSASG